MAVAEPPRGSAYWVDIVTRAASMALRLHRAPDVGTYQRLTARRVRDAAAPHSTLRTNPAILDVLCGCCRIEMNALRAPRGTMCYECGAEARFELLLWSEDLMVLETLHACAPHALATQCVWYLLVLPLQVYHAVRTRRTWKRPDLVQRRALVQHLSTCAYNALVAAVHLGLQHPPAIAAATDT